MSRRIPGDSYFIQTYGCQMNVHDSEHIAGVMQSSGFSSADSIEQADIVIFNTCMVRQSAEDRAWGNISSLASRNESALLAVCGCMAERYRVGIMSRCPQVRLVFGPGSLHRLPDIIEKSRGAQLCDLGDINTAAVDDLPAEKKSPSGAWVPVSHGCDRYCAYCVVPLVRGRERSRPVDEVNAEVRSLASAGVFEVTLLGQNVNSYGHDLVGRPSFADLLESVASVPGIRRVKFETSHPRDLSDSILRIMSHREEACEYLHLPVQSGSSRVLEAMGRGYDREFFLKRISRAREIVEGLVLSTDIMVGFPGETDRDFRDTMELVEAVGFDTAYMFIYSRREGTEAASMKNEVPGSVKSERFKELKFLQDGITERSLAGLVGRRVELLLEGHARSGDYTVGRTRGHRVVLVPDGQAPLHSLVEASVLGAGRHTARGRVEEVLLEPFV